MHNDFRSVFYFCSFWLAGELLLSGCHYFEHSWPSKSKGVNDLAKALNQREITLLNQQIADYESHTKSEFVLVIVADSTLVGTLEETAQGLFEVWSIGKSKQERGVLIVWQYRTKEIYIQVGNGLEAYLSPLQRRRIAKEFVLPLLLEKQYYRAFKAAVMALQIYLEELDPEVSKQDIFAFDLTRHQQNLQNIH